MTCSSSCRRDVIFSLCTMVAWLALKSWLTTWAVFSITADIFSMRVSIAAKLVAMPHGSGASAIETDIDVDDAPEVTPGATNTNACGGDELELELELVALGPRLSSAHRTFLRSGRQSAR